MIKKTLYPKTKRLSTNDKDIVVTEKLDGSNIGIFNIAGELVVSTRNTVFKASDDSAAKNYKGLSQWLKENGGKIQMHEGSGVFGEWMGMGKLKYPTFDKRMYLFAKANIDEEYNISNMNYNMDYLIYPFIDCVIPAFIGTVPGVVRLNSYPTIDELDSIYQGYREKEDRDIEGFVINQLNSIRKYVRMKNGKMSEHKE